jgi:hypothetical protein
MPFNMIVLSAGVTRTTTSADVGRDDAAAGFLPAISLAGFAVSRGGLRLTALLRGLSVEAAGLDGSRPPL